MIRFDSVYYDSFEEATLRANHFTKGFKEYNTAVRDSFGWHVTNRFDPNCDDKSEGRKTNIIKPNSQHKEQDDG